MKYLSTNGLVLAAVKAKLGVTVQPKSLVSQSIASGELVNICELSQPGIGYHLVSLPGRDFPGLRKFKAWLRKQAVDDV